MTKKRPSTAPAVSSAYLNALLKAQRTGFKPVDMDDIKAHFAVLIREHVRACYRSQYEAAQALGTQQPKISEIVNGKTDRILVETMLAMVMRAGLIKRIEVTVE